MRTQTVFAACFLLAPAFAQPDPWTALRSRNPANFDFPLRLVAPHPFHQGELIRVEARFPGPFFAPGQAPPPEQWQFTGFLLDPEAGCGSLAKPCTLSPGAAFARIGPGPAVGAREPVVYPLNDYVPALAPGHYRAAALVRKLVLNSRVPGSWSYGYADPPSYAVSSTVEFEVTPASPAWNRETIAAARAVLQGPQPASREAYDTRRAAAQQLQALDVPEAWRAALDALPAEKGILLTGLSETRRTAEVCELMQTRIPAPEQSVSSSYLYTVTRVCERAHLPAPPPPPSAAVPRRVAVARISPTPPPPAPAAAPRLSPEWAAYIAKQRAYRSELLGRATAALASSLPGKRPEPQAAAFVALIEHVRQLRYADPPEPDPAWVAALTREFVRAFPSVDEARRRYLLELYTSTIGGPEVVPLVEAVLDQWRPGNYYEAPHAALAALHRAEPARARARVLAELTKPQTWLDTAQLELLPPSAVPPMDEALIEALAAAQRPGGWNPRLRMAAIAKYATRRALPRIRAIYESQQDPCQPELAAYFVRVDPAYADRIFHREPWDMLAAAPRCAVQYFQRTPPLAMGPVLERYLAAYLMHRDVFVKTTAARMLGRHGSPAAAAPLWEAFRYFHQYWLGKGAELAGNGEGVNLEVELRNALARSSGWLAGQADLRTIEALCTSDRCRAETSQDLRAWQGLPRIELTDQPDGVRATVAQYYGLETLKAVEAKLAQFPRGTHFVLAAWGPCARAAAGPLVRFAASRGLVINAPAAVPAGARR